MLNDTEKNLYGDPNASRAPQAPTSFEVKDTSHAWAETQKTHIEATETPSFSSTIQIKTTHVGRAKKIALWVFVVAILGGGVAAFLVNYFSTKALAVEVQIPERVSAGKPFDVDFVYTNGTRTILQDARVSIELPDGVFLVDDPGRTKLQLTKTVGDLGVGSSGDVAFSVIALGEQGSVKEFKLVLNYKLNGLRSRYEKELNKQTAIGEPALQVDLVLPNKVQSDEQFNFEIHYTNTLDTPLEDAWIKMESPLGFSIKLSKPELASTNFWKLGTLQPNETGLIFISGVVTGQGRDVFRFTTTGGVTLKKQDIAIARKEGQTSVVETPFALVVTPEGSQGAIIKPGDSVQYKIAYKNSSGSPLNDVIIKATLVGSIIQIDKISSEGFIDPRDNTITWTAAQVPALKVLGVNEEGSVRFSVPTPREYPIRSSQDKNFTIKVGAEINSLSIPAYLQTQKSLGKASYETKVSGNIEVETSAFFRDAKSGMINRGPFPPRANEPTNYTIHWKIKNYAVNSNTIVVRSTLPPNAVFTGKISGNYGVNAPEYNSRTQEIVWKIPHVDANQGIISPSYEAIFQVTMTPTIFNKGSEAKLLERTVIEADDEFTGVHLSNVGKELTTLLPDDKTIGQREGIVQ
ncbi:MAG: hypothetical protein HZA35_03490 [Parcubacteria group bacterium]|nr:hypothetical protein [Parcubacteria group bacterium]